jgi:lipoate---protein ligase
MPARIRPVLMPGEERAYDVFMLLCDAEFHDPVLNLACDEALLDLREEGVLEPVLRFWTSKQPFIVLGYSNNIETEISLPPCLDLGIPIFRRISGGGTVVQAPGCLNYALFLDLVSEYRDIRGTNRDILDRHARVIRSLGVGAVTVEGQSDLALDGRKFSGNAQRRRRKTFMFHGTFLLGLDLELISRVLKHPSREPEYRAGRKHEEFLRNLRLGEEEVKAALVEEWGADRKLSFEESVLVQRKTEEMAQKTVVL